MKRDEIGIGATYVPAAFLEPIGPMTDGGKVRPAVIRRDVRQPIDRVSDQKRDYWEPNRSVDAPDYKTNGRR